MKKIPQEILEEIKKSDFSEKEQKEMQEILSDCEQPEIPNSKNFKNTLREKLERKMTNKQESERTNFIKNLPSFAKWRLRLTGFVSAFVIFLFLFITTFFNDFFREKIIIEEKIINTDAQSFSGLQKINLETPLLFATSLQTQKTNRTMITIYGDEEEEKINKKETEATQEDFEDIAVSENAVAQESFETTGPVLMGKADEELIYAFLYDGKKYPKLGEQLPVYKNKGAMMNTANQQQNINHMKIGNISLKNLELKNFDKLTMSNDDYTLDINFQDGSANIFGHQNDTKQKFVTTQNEKTIKKRIKTRFSQREINLNNYGDLVIDNINEDQVSFYFPFLIENKEVFYPSETEILPVKMYGTYNTSTDEIEIYNLDLAQYQKSQYPIIDQETVKETLIA